MCYDCQKAEMQGEIKDPEMKKMFDIPEEFYENNAFLRDIKIKYLKWGELTENQINEKVNTKYMSIDEIISLLIEVRVDLTILKKTVDSKDIKEQLKWAINGIDIVGCELAQNIAKKLKEK